MPRDLHELFHHLKNRWPGKFDFLHFDHRGNFPWSDELSSIIFRLEQSRAIRIAGDYNVYEISPATAKLVNEMISPAAREHLGKEAPEIERTVARWVSRAGKSILLDLAVQCFMGGKEIEPLLYEITIGRQVYHVRWKEVGSGDGPWKCRLEEMKLVGEV